MKLLKILFTLALISSLSCTSDDSDNGAVSVTIEASGLSDDKLALNNMAIFLANITGYNGDTSDLTYQWFLTTERGEFSDGINPLPNATTGGSSINCVGKTSGEEQIVVVILDTSNNTIATASYDFTIISPDDGGITRGCYDQPKIIYLRGLSLYTCNFDGSDQQFTGITGAYGANISPDGEWVAYVLDSFDPNGEGFIMQLLRCDGTDQIAIPGGTSAENFSLDVLPDFSPDSKMLYFLRPNFDSDDQRLELVAYNIETEEVTFLTSLYQQNGEVVQFTVSQTTGAIGFIRRTYNTNNTEVITTLSILQPETGFNQDLAILPSAQFFGMDWSTDGQDIIYSASTSGESGIFRINTSSGSQPILLFADPSTGTQPPLYPHYYANDTRIVWGGQENGTTSINLWTIDSNGGDMQQLIDVPQTIFMEGVLH